MPIRILYLFFLFLSSSALVAQDTVKEQYLKSELRSSVFEKTAWEKATKGLDYSGKAIPKKEERERAQKRRNYDTWDRNTGTNALGGALAKVLLIGGLIAIVLLLLINLSGAELNFGSNKKIQHSEQINLQQVEENLLESELEQLIRKAIESGNYALATRLYFLQTIKDLSIKNIIRWKPDKTNRDYLNEMKNHQHFDLFKGLSHSFDRIWYGQKNLSKDGFEEIETQFKHFLQAINKH